ncbi:MAG: DUF5106 domain-containing protein [Tannerella sp.]|jgi:hypothetical protein|nr:DUF5106 domain-containing protein [Tannerella sp.]
MLIGGILWGTATCHTSAQRTETKQPPSKPVFTMPAIPQTLTDPPSRANYLVTHYWDHFNFTDTACIHLPEVTEQALADYADILPYAAVPVMESSIRRLLSEAEKETSGRMYAYFLEMLDKYLYNPNSPFHDDEFYMPVVQYILTGRRSGEADKIRAKFTLEMMSKNRKGTTAANFTYTLADGKQGKLHDIRATYTLLMFYNPDCHACAEVIRALKQSSPVGKLHAAGTLGILLFYPDENIAAWKAHLPEIPAAWINGYDRHTKVTDNEIYDLRAIPTLYLLDKDKKVLLKDVNVERLEKWLKEQL